MLKLGQQIQLVSGTTFSRLLFSWFTELKKIYIFQKYMVQNRNSTRGTKLQLRILVKLYNTSIWNQLWIFNQSGGLQKRQRVLSEYIFTKLKQKLTAITYYISKSMKSSALLPLYPEKKRSLLHLPFSKDFFLGGNFNSRINWVLSR